MSRRVPTEQANHWLLSGTPDRATSRVDAFLDGPVIRAPAAPKAWIAGTLERVSAGLAAGVSPLSAMSHARVHVPRAARQAHQTLLGHLQAGTPFHTAIADPATGFDPRLTAVIDAFAAAGRLNDGLVYARRLLREQRSTRRLRQEASACAAWVVTAALAGSVALLADLPLSQGVLARLSLVAASLTVSAAIGTTLTRSATLATVLSRVGVTPRRNGGALAEATFSACLAVQLEAGISFATAARRAAPVAKGTELEGPVGTLVAHLASGSDVATALAAEPALSSLADVLAAGRTAGRPSQALWMHAQPGGDVDDLPAAKGAWRLLVPTLSLTSAGLLLAAFALTHH